MTTRRLGHRAAAQGNKREVPEGDGAMEWLLAYDTAEFCRANGRDPKGHPPHVPRLCMRDVSKVCNCCDGCKRECWAEGLIVNVEKVRERARGLVWNALKAYWRRYR